MISPTQILDFTRPWSADHIALNWYGSPILLNNNDVMINMIVAPVVPRSRITFSAPATVPISIGQLPILTTGTLWKRGSYFGVRPSQTLLLKNVLIHPDTARVEFTADLYNDSEWVQLINTKHPTKCLVVPHAESTPHYTFSEVVFPMTEILRFYYGNSSSLLEAIMSGQAVEEAVYSMKDGLTRQIDSTIWQIRLRQTIPNSDAGVAARFAFDEYARKQANAIYMRSIYPAINGQANIPIIEALPPFIGNTDLKVRGILHKDRFWVLEILQCSHPFPFNYLEVTRDNSGETVAGVNRDELEEYKRGGYRQKNFDVEDIPLDSSSKPRAKQERKPIKLFNSRFTELDLSKIRSQEKTEQKYRSVPAVFRVPHVVSPIGSTLQPEWDKELFAAYVYTQNLPTDSNLLPKVEYARFDDFIPAIEEIGRERTITAQFRVLAGFAVNSNSSTHSFCPIFPPVKDAPFGYIDKRQKPLLNGRRQLIIAEISSYEQYFYMIDFQKKPGESVAMILLYDERHQRLNDHELCDEIIDFCRGRETYFIDSIKNGLIRERLKRYQIAAPSDLASRITERIRRYFHNKEPGAILEHGGVDPTL